MPGFFLLANRTMYDGYRVLLLSTNNRKITTYYRGEYERLSKLLESKCQHPDQVSHRLVRLLVLIRHYFGRSVESGNDWRIQTGLLVCTTRFNLCLFGSDLVLRQANEST